MRFLSRKPKRQPFISDAVRERLDYAIRELPVDEPTQRTLLAVVGAGVYAGDCVLRLDTELRRYWTSSEEQMLGVVWVFSAAMLSRWIRKGWPPPLASPGIREAKEAWASGLRNIFGPRGDPDVGLQGFLQVDAQFNADSDFNDEAIAQGGHVRFIDHDLLLGLAGAALGRPLANVQLQLPVDDLFDLLAQGWIPVEGPPTTSVEMSAIMLDAEALMYEIHEQLG